MKDNKTKQKFIEHRAAGHSFDKIAKELKVAKSTLINWSKEFEYEISNLKAIELESLQEQYYVTKRARIELIGTQIERLKEVLVERDLKDISTEKLLDLFIKYIQSLKYEETDTIFKNEKEEEIDDLINMTSKKVESWKAN